MKITFVEYRQVCIENGFCTCCSNQQYVKIAGMISRGCSVGDLALVTWLCSENRFTLNEITAVLANRFIRGY